MVDVLRRNGHPVGLISGTLYRPFPDLELVEAMARRMPKLQVIGAFDGSIDPVPGATYSDVKMALFDYWNQLTGRRMPPLMDFKYCGGQNPSLSAINGAFERMRETAKNGKVEIPIQQLDRNSEGANISLDETNQGVLDVLADQTIVEFVGRGGLGAISAAANLVSTTNDASAELRKLDKQSAVVSSRGIPQFGSEKTGSPTFGIAVGDKKPITNYNIEGPRDSFVFFRPDLITQKHVKNLRPGGFFLVNTDLAPANIRKRYQVPAGVRIYTIDASKMAKDVLVKDFPNNVLLAALAKINPALITLEQLSASIQRSLRKKGENIISKNFSLIRAAADNLRTEGEVS